MALFKHNSELDIDPFTDLVFNTLLTFTFLFLVTLFLLNPPSKTGIIDPKAELLVTVSWPDGNSDDIDLWASGPGGTVVWYKHPQGGLMNIDRDDRGLENDTQLINGKVIVNPLNQEVLTIRGRTPGEYVVNVSYFKSEDRKPVPVKVYLADVNPKLKVLYYGDVQLKKQGDEVTAFRFSLNNDGKVVDINQLQKPLAKAYDK